MTLTHEARQGLRAKVRDAIYAELTDAQLRTIAHVLGIEDRPLVPRSARFYKVDGRVVVELDGVRLPRAVDYDRKMMVLIGDPDAVQPSTVTVHFLVAGEVFNGELNARDQLLGAEATS